jgi:hypothetical protein
MQNETASYGKIQEVEGAPLSFFQVQVFQSLQVPESQFEFARTITRAVTKKYAIPYQDADCLLFSAKSDSWSYSLVQGSH